MANTNRNAYVQYRFMAFYFDDMAFTLSQIPIQDLEMPAETTNIHVSMSEYVPNQRHFINFHGNMQAIHGNIPENHDNMQAIHGNMQAIHNMPPINGNIQAIYANMQAIHVYNDWQVNLLDRMGGEEL
ncbi:uncharacterized protein LOC111346655 isoform X2 [Stylophora pistillata]|uniref:uncharacterized protein LOC111346655 isoform X2 n=1 Tax=Stylophora pistillata TaxID=50429 RepID=UPI000C03C57D|nr:uncharacterized protein LOC111346655 isoform X2 [Stylophora pistillata]